MENTATNSFSDVCQAYIMFATGLKVGRMTLGHFFGGSSVSPPQTKLSGCDPISHVP